MLFTKLSAVSYVTILFETKDNRRKQTNKRELTEEELEIARSEKKTLVINLIISRLILFLEFS